MAYHGHVKNGQILDEPARLPEGAAVRVEVLDAPVRVTRPPEPVKLPPFEPLRITGGAGSLADELVRDRR